MKKSFILHYDSLSVIDKMTDDQTGKLLRMMKSYHNGRDYICNDFAVELVFEQFKNQFDRDLEKYNRICERNANNWSLWWRPKEPKEPSGLITNPKEPKKADSDSDNKNDSVNDNNKKNNNIFKKPTHTEIKEYCIERKNKVDPQRFIDYYDSVWWMVWKNKMKDWKATIRWWESRDKEKKIVWRKLPNVNDIDHI